MRLGVAVRTAIAQFFGDGPSPRRLATLFFGAVAAFFVATFWLETPLAPLAIGASFGLVSLALGGVFVRAFGDVVLFIRVIHARLRLQGLDVPALVETPQGTWLNRAARNDLRLHSGGGIGAFLSRYTVEPEAVAARLRAESSVGRPSNFRIATNIGHLSVSASALGIRSWQWTIEMREAPPPDHPTPILTIDDAGKVLFANGAAEDLFGRVPVSIFEVLPDLPATPGEQRRVMTVFGQQDVSVFELRAKSERVVYLVPLQVPDVSPLAAPGLLDAMPVPMLKIATDGCCLAANVEARAIFDIDAEQELPPLYELVEGMGRPISDWVSEAAQGRGLLKPQIVRATLPGKEVFLQIALGRAEENGEVVLFGILNDATELKTLEGQFVQSQKMQAIGQLAGGIAHDFNNLLTAIGGHCDLLLLRHDQEDPDYADLIQIEQNANRAASLVSQLLAFSRKQNMRPQVVDLRDTMSELAHLLNRLIGERVQLEVGYTSDLQRIRADRRQLEQVIINLVVNARDAMPDGGRISIESRTEHLALPYERDGATVPCGDYVVIDVSDTGVGISPEIQNKIFEPFYTTKTPGKGTGLGLSTAYGIIKQSGGFIFVESTVGDGTCFTLYLPASLVETDKPEGMPIKPLPTMDGSFEGVVLLVEDEAPVRAFASRALRLRGYTVIEAASGEDALEALEDNSLDVDIFVTDVVMPGMDGPTWVRQALEQRPNTRTIFVSGYSEEGRVENQSRIPNSVFLPKPFSLEQLTMLVHEQIA